MKNALIPHCSALVNTKFLENILRCTASTLLLSHSLHNYSSLAFYPLH